VLEEFYQVVHRLQMIYSDSNAHQPKKKFCSFCKFCLAPQASTTKISLVWSPCPHVPYEMVDEVPSLAMCLPMHEPTQESEETNSAENPEVETPGQQPDEGDNAAQQAQDDRSDSSAKEESIDPWEALEIEAAKWEDQAVRTAAELDNFRKRMSREKLDAVRYGNQNLLEELLPVLDNFDMGMQAAAQEQGSMLYMGMKMVHQQLGEFLSSQNVEEIAAEAGGEFDPTIHEALSQETNNDIEEGKIIRVVRKGYRIGERLLRPSNVIIAISAAASEEKGPNQQESE